MNNQQGYDLPQWFIPTTATQLNCYEGNICDGQPRILLGRQSKKVLDIEGGVHGEGANLIQYARHGGPNQQFIFQKVQNNPPLFKIMNVNSGLVLDVEGTSHSNGAQIHQWKYHGGANQHWRIEPAKKQGYYNIFSVNSNKVIDVSDYSTKDCAKVHQWDCHGGDNQMWKILRVDQDPEKCVIF